MEKEYVFPPEKATKKQLIDYANYVGGSIDAGEEPSDFENWMMYNDNDSNE